MVISLPMSSASTVHQSMNCRTWYSFNQIMLSYSGGSNALTLACNSPTPEVQQNPRFHARKSTVLIKIHDSLFFWDLTKIYKLDFNRSTRRLYFGFYFPSMNRPSNQLSVRYLSKRNKVSSTHCVTLLQYSLKNDSSELSSKDFYCLERLHLH